MALTPSQGHIAVRSDRWPLSIQPGDLLCDDLLGVWCRQRPRRRVQRDHSVAR